MEKTLSIIKPDGVKKNIIGEVIKRFQDNDINIAAIKMIKLSKKEAQGFYAVHKERCFYRMLTDFNTSGTILMMVVRCDCVIFSTRKHMCVTNFEEAVTFTIRKAFGIEM